MAKTGSYIKLDRGLKTNSLWLQKPFSQGQAWVDLLILAQGVDTEKQHHGRTQKIFRGNVYTSITFLSDRWGWSRNKVYRFLEELMLDRMIVVKGWTLNGTNNGTINRTRNDTKNGTVVTIENWEFYQDSVTTNETINGTTKRTRNFLKTEHTIESKKNKEKRKESKKEKSITSPLDGASDVPKAMRMKPIDEGTVDDIPEDVRDMFKTYADYWRFANQ